VNLSPRNLVIDEVAILKFSVNTKKKKKKLII